jgi:hypothetical protein|tara:strand:- start:108 stop:284 length:177 start_codon:yes stop_codon:yes gene_type:complete
LLFVVKEIFLFLLLPLLHSFFFQQKEEEEDEEGLAVDFVKVAYRDEEDVEEDAIILTQ